MGKVPYGHAGAHAMAPLPPSAPLRDVAAKHDQILSGGNTTFLGFDRSQNCAKCHDCVALLYRDEPSTYFKMCQGCLTIVGRD